MIFKPLTNETAPEDPKSIIEACLKDINYWMNINKLKLNNGKTELLLIQSPHRPLPPLQNINCAWDRNDQTDEIGQEYWSLVW